MEIDTNNNHNTNTKWIVWYHNPSDKNWNLSSYKDIIEVSCLEDFCVLKNSWNLCLPNINEGMFFLMRQNKDKTNIYPQWEDRNNRDGGYWSYKVDKNFCEEAWNVLFMKAIGESLTKELEDMNLITGISISPKKSFSILKIWNNDCNKNSIDILSDFKYFDKKQVIYSNHKNNIKKDYLKSQKKKNHNPDNDGFVNVRQKKQYFTNKF